MVGRRRIHKTAVAVILVASCLFQRCRSVVDGQQIQTGTQTISQECAPRRRKRHVIVDDISLVCDYQAYEEVDDYNYDYYYQDNNQEGDSSDENDQNNNQYQYQNNQNQNDDNQVYYTNRLTCQPGDTAKLAMSFRIRNMKNYTVGISIKASFYGSAEIRVVREKSNMCEFRSLEFLGETDYDNDNGQYLPACPLKEGPYELFTAFTVPKFMEDTDFFFTPSLQIEFYDFYEDEQPLIGCVETGTLAQFAIHKNLAARGELVLIAFTTIFVAAFAICLFGHRRRRKVGELAEANRKAAIIRRFHYRRTAQNGSVMMHPRTGMSSESEASYSLPSNLREVT